MSIGMCSTPHKLSLEVLREFLKNRRIMGARPNDLLTRFVSLKEVHRSADLRRWYFRRAEPRDTVGGMTTLKVHSRDRYEFDLRLNFSTPYMDRRPTLRIHELQQVPLLLAKIRLPAMVPGIVVLFIFGLQEKRH